MLCLQIYEDSIVLQSVFTNARERLEKDCGVLPTPVESNDEESDSEEDDDETEEEEDDEDSKIPPLSSSFL